MDQDQIIHLSLLTPIDFSMKKATLHSPMSPITTTNSNNIIINGHNNNANNGNNIVSSNSNNDLSDHHPTSSSTCSNSSNRVKAKASTRPFKAYPKDPMTFPTVGLFGLPLNVPLPGTTESLIYQQSNHAYAEFRRQMLSQTQNKIKQELNSPPEQQQLLYQQLPQRDLSQILSLASSSPFVHHLPQQHQQQQQQQQQIHIPQLLPISNSALSSTTDVLKYRISLLEHVGGGGGGGATSSGAEDSHSNSDEGFGSSDKHRLGLFGSTEGLNDSHHNHSNGCTKLEQQMKDEAYWERRRKNNEAAKRSRDARRAKEDEIAIRAAFLEQENLKLRFEVCTLKNEIAKLRCMLYKSP